MVPAWTLVLTFGLFFIHDIARGRAEKEIHSKGRREILLEVLHDWHGILIESNSSAAEIVHKFNIYICDKAHKEANRHDA